MIGAHLGDAAEDELKRKATQATYNVAATQMAISLALNFVPVVGQAISAILSVINLFTGRAIKKALQKEMGGIKERLTSHGEKRKAEVEGVRKKVEAEEREKKRLEQQVHGLGDMWKKLGQRLEKIPEQVIDVIQNPAKFKTQATKVFGTVTGRESLAVMREKLNVIEEETTTKIDAQAEEVKKNIQSPEGRAEIRKQIDEDDAEADGDAAGDSSAAGSSLASSLPWILGSLAVVSVAGILLLRRKRAP